MYAWKAAGRVHTAERTHVEKMWPFGLSVNLVNAAETVVAASGSSPGVGLLRTPLASWACVGVRGRELKAAVTGN